MYRKIVMWNVKCVPGRYYRRKIVKFVVVRMPKNGITNTEALLNVCLFTCGFTHLYLLIVANDEKWTFDMVSYASHNP